MGTLKRTLFADFQLYTEGDSAFKNELIVLMVANILELQRATDLSLDAFEVIAFREVCHKINTTLNILSDEEVNALVYEIRRNGGSEAKITFLRGLCSQIIASLEAELTISVADVYPVRIAY